MSSISPGHNSDKVQSLTIRQGPQTNAALDQDQALQTLRRYKKCKSCGVEVPGYHHLASLQFKATLRVNCLKCRMRMSVYQKMDSFFWKHKPINEDIIAHLETHVTSLQEATLTRWCEVTEWYQGDVEDVNTFRFAYQQTIEEYVAKLHRLMKRRQALQGTQGPGHGDDEDDDDNKPLLAMRCKDKYHSMVFPKRSCTSCSFEVNDNTSPKVLSLDKPACFLLDSDGNYGQVCLDCRLDGAAEALMKDESFRQKNDFNKKLGICMLEQKMLTAWTEVVESHYRVSVPEEVYNKMCEWIAGHSEDCVDIANNIDMDNKEPPLPDWDELFGVEDSRSRQSSTVTAAQGKIKSTAVKRCKPDAGKARPRDDTALNSTQDQASDLRPPDQHVRMTSPDSVLDFGKATIMRTTKYWKRRCPACSKAHKRCPHPEPTTSIANPPSRSSSSQLLPAQTTLSLQADSETTFSSPPSAQPGVPNPSVIVPALIQSEGASIQQGNNLSSSSALGMADQEFLANCRKRKDRLAELTRDDATKRARLVDLDNAADRTRVDVERIKNELQRAKNERQRIKGEAQRIRRDIAEVTTLKEETERDKAVLDAVRQKMNEEARRQEEARREHERLEQLIQGLD